MKNLRLYQTEADYTSDPIEREYPTVSYIQDTDKVEYEKQMPKTITYFIDNSYGDIFEFTAIEGDTFGMHADELTAYCDGRIFQATIAYYEDDEEIGGWYEEEREGYWPYAWIEFRLSSDLNLGSDAYVKWGDVIQDGHTYYYTEWIDH